MDILTLQLQSDKKEPIYHQLYSYIKEEIQSGRIASDTKLPSKRKLSSYLSISQNTIQAAYDQLIEEGYITAVEKRGFYVCKIDFQQKLKVHLPAQINRKSTQSEIMYDFSYHGVDIPSFPFDIWRKLMKDSINEYDLELLIPGDSLGNLRLRTAIAEYLHQSRGVNCTEDQIIISSGTEMLFQALM